MSTSLFFEDHPGPGGDVPTLIMIHGLSLDSRLWEPNVQALTRHARVTCVDMRGFGRSPRVTGPYSHNADLLELLDQLEIGAAVLVGKSAGGRWCIDFALAHPDRVKAMVLADSSISGWPWKSFIQSWAPIQAAARAGNIDKARELWLGHSLFAPALKHPSAGPMLRSMVEAYDMWHFANVDPNPLASPSAASRISELVMPLMILVGEHDLEDFIDISMALSKAPNAQLVVEPGVGHLTNMECAESFNAEVIRFLKDL